jgi:hypothetical protein
MRRTLIGLTVVVLTVLAFAVPANAAAGQVTVFRFKDTFATAEWFSSTATSFTDTTISVSQPGRGSGLPTLNVYQLKGNLDADGNFTGGTETFTAEPVTSGFTFTIDTVKLTSASTSGSGLPATTCTLDADFNQSDCTSTTIDVNATWTGQGSTVQNSHFRADGFTSNTHFSGTLRAAAATGTIGGVTLNAADVVFAQLGIQGEGSIRVCAGC